MGAILVGSERCMEANLTIPIRGAWTADVQLASSTVLEKGSRQTFKIGGLELIGTVIRSRPYAGATRARLVGGAGGWRKMLPARGYSHIAGVKKSSVIQDAAREAGETVSIASDRVVGKHWARDRAAAERVLTILAGGEWWIDNEGVTQVRPRPRSKISSTFTVNDRSAGKGRFEISTETFQDWIPGRTFTAPTVTDEQLISLVTINSTNDGTTRLTVLTDDEGRERMLDDFRAIVRQELAELTLAGLWEYKISTATSETVDASPVSTKRVPALTRVPMLPGIMSEESTPAPGTLCYITFVDANPAKPMVVHVKGTPLSVNLLAGGMVGGEHVATVEAVALLIYNVFVSLMALTGPGPLTISPAVQAMIGPAVLAALAAQAAPAPPTAPAQVIAASAQIAGFATGAAPANTSIYFKPNIDLLVAKIANDSGLFPSLGSKAVKAG